MHWSLRTKIVLWFAFVVAAVAIAGLSGFRRLSSSIREEAEAQISAKLDHVMDVLETTDSTYLRHARSAMLLLRMLCEEAGPPRLVAAPGGAARPELFFGNERVSESNAIVDRVQQIMGGTATLFVRDGENFVRVSTNVPQTDGTRAQGTILDPAGPAMAAIRKGEAYSGIAEILGKPYLTIYEPLRDPSGSTIGVYYVGYTLASLSAINDAIEDRGILDLGFFALLDQDDRVILRTRRDKWGDESTAVLKAIERGAAVNPRWFVTRKEFTPWRYEVVAALHLPDVARQTVKIIWQVYGVGSAVILGVLVVSFVLASRLSNALAEADASRKEALEARDAAESANRTKSTFLANMSHELRTPMNAIIGYSEMLIEDARDAGSAAIVPDLEKIRVAGRHLLSLINDVLDLSKIEAGKMTLFNEVFEVGAMITEVAETVRPLVNQKQNVLEVECPPGIGTMEADVTKVRQTLFNLLSNAGKFTERGRIILSVARRGDEPGGDRIRFVVTDTGIGMSAEALSRLFQAFSQADASTTRKYGGTGLGLVISRKFCQMMGGDITVHSEAGKGTTFAVELPAAPPGSAPAATSQPQPSSGATSPHTVLIIEDDADSAEILRRALAKSGFHAVIAQKSEEGLAAAKRLHPTAITLDIMMPGMDGWAVLTRLKSDPETARIPVIIVSMLQDRQLGFALGATDFLTKPVNPERLREILEKFCGKQAGHVLIVDDDPSAREVLAGLLKSHGIQAREAPDGRAALEMVKAARPALVLLDLLMPVMDGFEFLSTLRSIHSQAEIPVVVVTALDLSPEERQRLTGGVSQNAMDREKLAAEIAALLRRRP